MNHVEREAEIAKLNSWIELCDGDPTYQTHLRERRDSLLDKRKQESTHAAADRDIRADVLAGLDRQIDQTLNHRQGDYRLRSAVWSALLDALLLLREDTERHVHTLYADPYLGSVRSCQVCGAPDGAGPDHWCETIISRAKVYAPDALSSAHEERRR